MSQQLIAAAKNVATKKGLVDGAKEAVEAAFRLWKAAEEAYYKAHRELEETRVTLTKIAEVLNDGLSAPRTPEVEVAPEFQHGPRKEHA